MKQLVLIILTLVSFTLSSQRIVTKNLRTFDNGRLIHFGAYLGVNNLTFKVIQADNFNTLDSIYSFEINARPGFNLGIVSDLHLGDGLDLRCLPALSFGQRDIEYSVFNQTGELFTEVRQVESTFAEIPFLFKYKSSRANNLRVYLLGGGKVSYDFASNKDVHFSDKSVVRLTKIDYGYEFGVGLDFYLEFFKFSPEIRVYHGMRDVLINDNTFRTTSIDKLLSRSVMFSFTFEG